MKANAPERIWIDPTTDLPKLSGHIDKDSVEYIRKDTFINKAYEWFKNNWREYINTDKDGVVCFGHWEKDFEKYMEGE